MNIVAEEIYIGKFDPVLGASRIESKVQKGESIPEDHLRAFRMGKEEVLYSWLKYVQQIVLRHFVAVGKPVEEKRLFQYRFSACCGSSCARTYGISVGFRCAGGTYRPDGADDGRRGSDACLDLITGASSCAATPADAR